MVALASGFFGLIERASAAIVLEVHVGGRPPETSQIVQPLLDELQKRGMIARPSQVHARLGDHHTRPGITDPTLDIGAIINRADAARRLLKKGACGNAEKQFAEVIDRARENLAMLVNSRAESQKALMDALEGFAVCLDLNRKRKESDLAWEELVRSYPSQEATIRSKYGTEPYLRYQAAQKRLADRGSGTLIVEVDDRSALIFFNEWDHPQTAVYQATVLPGVYRVLALSPGTAGRWYEVEVAPGDRVHLKLNSGFDSAVTVSEAWAGFVFSSEREASHLIDYARQLLGPNEVVLITVAFTDLAGRRAVMGSVYQLGTGTRLRSHAVPLKGIDDEARLRALAHALVDPIAIEPEVIPLHAVAAAPARVAEPRESSSAKWWLAGGAGLIGAAGGALIALDNEDECSNGADCKYRIHSAPSGYVCLGLAAALALGSGYLFYSDSDSASTQLRAGVAPIRDGMVASITGAF